MARDVRAIMRPQSVAVLGASATRITQGNHVIGNLQRAGFAGRIIPVHATAATINDLPAVNAISALPPGVDVAVIAVPAGGVAAVLAELDQAKVRSAVVFSNGFSAEQERQFRRVSDATAMSVHGPNCMGLIDFYENMPLYPSTVTAKARRGNVALIAQSGSAAISLMNSSSFGVTTVLTMGSEFQVTAPDYIRFFADDRRTEVVGVVLESIQRPDEFAEAVRLLYAAGKSLAVLKVGRSEVGNRAVQAHTGAMISRNEGYERFFARHHVPTARDYDELIATLECFAMTRQPSRGKRVGIIGISGGETALACDVAADLGMLPAVFSDETKAKVRAVLPGASGSNPLDLGATVGHKPEHDSAAIEAILRDDGVDALVFVQDCQATLTPTMLNNYTPHMLKYAAHGQSAEKPVVVVSPTAENTHPRVHEIMGEHGVPVLRGMRAGLVALRNLGVLGEGRAGTASAAHQQNAAADDILREIAGMRGPLAPTMTRRILEAYGVPLVRSAIAADEAAVVSAAEKIGYPVVLKVESSDIPHRSDVGGVAVGITDAQALRAAMARMRSQIGAALPQARIEGFQVQEYLVDWVEAMVGFIAAPPFGALLTVGTGGTMVELLADGAVELCPISAAQAGAMIGSTRLGQYLDGYRNLIARTDSGGLTKLVAALSRMAVDLCGAIGECDINPVLVRKGSGEVRVVDALLVARGG